MVGEGENRRFEMIYDVAIIGGGPAGLMAAKTAAEQGMKAVLIEKRRDISQITRACCMQFIMDDGYEKERIELKEGKIAFTRNGFEVDYDGPVRNLLDKYYISPGGHRIHFANKDRTPFAIKFDKGVLLKGLWEASEKAGAELRGGAVAYDVEDNPEGVEVKLTSGGAKSTLKARKLLCADGVNSRMAEALGMNKDRTFLSTAVLLVYMVEGLKDYEPTTWTTYMGRAYGGLRSVIIAPGWGNNIAEMVVGGNRERFPEQSYHNISTNGTLAPRFEKARVVEKVGCSVKAFLSLKVPYRGNVLAIGDATAYVEVEVQGALMCGFHAARAVKKELEGERGFEEYTTWWQDSFEFNGDEYMQVAQGYALIPTYTDDELDYLFALTEDQVPEGTYSQYKSPRLMWSSMLRHKEKIASERPEIFEKIKRNQELTLKDAL
jgi:flavin-dependent dehydrogenase